MIVLDTNVLSETLRPAPAAAVRRWMAAQPAATLFTAAICEAELRYGLALMPAGRRRTSLARALAAIFEEFATRILAFDSHAAQAYADIAATRRRIGRPISQFDAQIAAIAAANGFRVATRNVDDFAECGIPVVSPWAD
jgi:hypothetical protein